MRPRAITRLAYCFVFLFVGFQSSAYSRTVQSTVGLVVADSELASQAGMDMLRRGGNAVDAAIATALTLSVVDQASSGLGGGGFMVIYIARERKAFALDFRETAPAAARPELYMKDGAPLASASLSGGLAVAVPAEAAGLIEARRRFGSLPLTLLAAPALKYAREGFPLDPALRLAIERQRVNMKKYTDLGRIYMPYGELPKEGQMIRQPELAQALEAFAHNGATDFYSGWIAQAIVETTRKAGGVITLEDLKNYRPLWREPLIGSYRNRTIITMPPPSSGGVAILQMLNILEGYKLSEFKQNSPEYLHLLSEAMKHAFADRAQFLGDPDFVHVPVRKLTAKTHAEWIRTRISMERTQPPAYYGYYHYNAEKGGTTHFSVIDRFGNAVACTQSVNTRFGSKLLVSRAGIVLNNEMDDFAIHPQTGNVYGLVGNAANSLEPGKRPLSSMSPTIILRGSRPEIVAGAAGGPRIISATLQTILNVLDFANPVTAAVSAPRVHHQWLPDRLNVEPRITPEDKAALQERGHVLRDQSSLGVVQAITWQGTKMSGAADPRKIERARTD